jgi:hypothetical protein
MNGNGDFILSDIGTNKKEMRYKDIILKNNEQTRSTKQDVVRKWHEKNL